MAAQSSPVATKTPQHALQITQLIDLLSLLSSNPADSAASAANGGKHRSCPTYYA
jgi:hypothetical protein